MKTISQVALFALLLVLSSCTSNTKIISSWRDPAVSINATGMKKVWVMCLVQNESTRRTAEDFMAQRRPGVIFPTYERYPSEIMKDHADLVNDGIAKSGYEAIIIMRLVSKDQATSYVPGTSPSYYGGWHGYYGYAATYYYDPGYYRTDEFYNVETNVYSLTNDKLLWTGMTETMNPGTVQSAIREIADAISQQMRKEGFLVEAAK